MREYFRNIRQNPYKIKNGTKEIKRYAGKHGGNILS